MALIDLALGGPDAVLNDEEMVNQRGDISVNLVLGGQAHLGVVHFNRPPGSFSSAWRTMRLLWSISSMRTRYRE